MKQRVKLDMTDETYHCSMILCLRIQACKFSPVLIVKFKSFAGKMCGQTSKLRREFFPGSILGAHICFPAIAAYVHGARTSQDY